MKYVDSFTYTFTQTAAGTSYSPWYDVSWATELYAYTTHTFAETVTGDESEIISVQRYIPGTSLATNGTDVLTFSTRTDDATVEEKYASAHTYDGNAAIGADQKIGTRVRFEMVSTGTGWSTDQSISVVCVLYAKRN